MTCAPWTLDPGECCPDWATFSPEVQARAEELAWETLRILTGGMVGNCPVTFRPCVDVPCGSCVNAWTVIAGQPVHDVCGGSTCSCPSLSEIILPGRVAEVTSIVQDGTVMSPADYRLDGNRIVRLDGLTWPACQDMRLFENDFGALVVYYIPGREPGSNGLFAASVLACEYGKACLNGKCRLPSSVVSITRQGVSMQLGQDLFPGGMTGIREVDTYLYTVNPHALSVPPTAWSPDVVSGRATGTMAG